MSEQTYKTEKAFKREVARRLRIADIGEALWDETGGSRWRDASVERGFALLEDLNFVVSQLRYRRRIGELPPALKITGEPKDLQMWWLRSRFTGWCLEPRARDWRRRLLPPTLPAGATEDEWIEPERGTVRQEKIRDWLQGLARFEGGFFAGQPVVRGGPDLQLPQDSQIFFSFPDTDAPRFINKMGAPEVWWSASHRPGGRLELDARFANGPSGEVWSTLEAHRLMEGLTREWDWIKRGTAWSLADAAGFYIFGATPTLSPLSAHVSSGVDAAGWGRKITMQVDSRISPEEVMQFYSRVLAGDRPPRVKTRISRGFSARVIELLDFVFARTLPDQRYDWGKLWSEWQALNAAKPDRLYSSASNFERVLRRALKKLNREGWLRQ